MIMRRLGWELVQSAPIVTFAWKSSFTSHFPTIQTFTSQSAVSRAQLGLQAPTDSDDQPLHGAPRVPRLLPNSNYLRIEWGETLKQVEMLDKGR